MEYLEELSKFVSDNVHEYYSGLFAGGILLGIAFILMSAAIFAVIYYYDRLKEIGDDGEVKAPEKVSKTPHYIFIAVIIAFALALAGNVRSGLTGIGLFIILEIAAFAVIYMLVTVRTLAPFAAAAYMWASWLYMSLSWIGAAVTDARRIDDYDISAKMPVFAAGNYLVLKALLLELVIAVATPVMICYVLRFQRWVYANGGTARIDLEPASLFDTPKETLEKLKKQLIALTLVIALVFVPLIFSSTTRYLSKGDTPANNAYIEYILQYKEDSSVTEDSDWAFGFIDAYNALEEVNLRVYNIDPRKVRYDDMMLFTDYSYAANYQLLAMKGQYESIMSGDRDAVDVYNDEFDYSNSLKQDALLGAFSRAVNGSDGLISKVVILLVSAFQFYTSFINLAALGITLIILSIIVIALCIVMKAGRKVPKEMSVSGFLAGSREKYIYTPPAKKEILIWTAAWAIVLTVLVVIPLIRSAGGREITYTEAVSNAVIDTAEPVFVTVTSASGSLSDTEKTEAIKAIDDQIAAVDVLTGFKDVDSEYLVTHERVLVQAPVLKDTLAEMKGSIEDGKAPERQMVQRYTALELKLMEDVKTIKINDAVTQIFEMFDD